MNSWGNLSVRLLFFRGAERRQYLGEIGFARRIGDQGARRTLIENYLSERNRTIENYYQRPYGGAYNANPFGGN